MLAAVVSPPAVIAFLVLFAVVSAAVGVSMLVGTAWTLIFLSAVALTMAVLLARGMRWPNSSS